MVQAINRFMDSLTDVQKKELTENHFQIRYEHFSDAQRNLLNNFHLQIAPTGTIEINGKVVDKTKCSLSLSFNTLLTVWAGNESAIAEIATTTPEPTTVAARTGGTGGTK